MALLKSLIYLEQVTVRLVKTIWGGILDLLSRLFVREVSYA